MSDTGRFELVRVLGEGAFGLVHEAFDRERGLRVAHKSLKRMEPRARERFKAEFRGLAGLTHPNLPLYYELFSSGDEWFFTMELIDGVPLDVWVRGEANAPAASQSDTGSLTEVTNGAAASQSYTSIIHAGGWSEPKLRGALEQLRNVLSFLHARGAVHRDLKPSNLRVRDDGRVMLLDFGLATRAGVAETHFVGTAAYAAPEQSRPGPITPAADAFALGTILFELLCGRRPWPGSGAQVMLDKQQRAPPTLLGAPEDLTALVNGWLVKEPQARAPVAQATEVFEEYFVGRTAELAALHEAFDAVLAGDTRVVVVEGESGIGKSALVQRALDELRTRAPESSFFTGRPSPREKLPFNAFDGVLAAARLAPGVPRSEVFRAMREVLERSTPLVLWLDDMQWADEDSVELLLALLRPPQLKPGLIILSRRSAPEPLVLPCARTVLPLGPLAPEDAAGLARRLGAAGSIEPAKGHPLFIKELARRTGRTEVSLPLDAAAQRLDAAGSIEPAKGRTETSLPLDTAAGSIEPAKGQTETGLSLGSAAGSIEPAKGRTETSLTLDTAAGSIESTNDRAETNLSLDTVLTWRLDALPKEERALLNLVAVSAAPLGEARLATASGLARGVVATALERLARAQLTRLDATPGRQPVWRTYHDKIREVLLHGLDHEARRAAHHAVLGALGDNDDELPARLEHLLGAGRTTEAAAVARQAAARAAAVGAYTRAAGLLGQALTTGAIAPHDEPEVRRQRLVLLERSLDAHEAAEEAMALAALNPPDAGALHMRAARHFLATGDLKRGREVLSHILAAAGVRMPQGTPATLFKLVVARFQVWLALRRGSSGKGEPPANYSLLRTVADGFAMTDHVRGHLFQTRALRAALASADLALRAEALMIEALYVGSTAAKGRRAAERYMAAARALFPGQPLPPRAQAWEAVARATHAKHERPSQAVVEKLRAAEDGVEALGGDPWLLGSTRLVRGHCMRLMGDLPALRVHARTLVEDAERRSDFFVLTTGHLGGVAVWLADDAPMAARQLVSQVRWPDEPATFLVQHWLAAEAEVEISLYEGSGGTLLNRLGATRGFLRFSPVKRLQSVRICCNYTLGRALVAAMEAGTAGWLERLELRLVIRSLRRENIGFASVRATLLEAGWHASRKEVGTALALLERARGEGTEAGLLLEPLVADWLTSHLDPAREGEREGAEAAARALGIRNLAAFHRIVAPGFGPLAGGV